MWIEGKRWELLSIFPRRGRIALSRGYTENEVTQNYPRGGAWPGGVDKDLGRSGSRSFCMVKQLGFPYWFLCIPSSWRLGVGPMKDQERKPFHVSKQVSFTCFWGTCRSSPWLSSFATCSFPLENVDNIDCPLLTVRQGIVWSCSACVRPCALWLKVDHQLNAEMWSSCEDFVYWGFSTQAFKKCERSKTKEHTKAHSKTLSQEPIPENHFQFLLLPCRDPLPPRKACSIMKSLHGLTFRKQKLQLAACLAALPYPHRSR